MCCVIQVRGGSHGTVQQGLHTDDWLEGSLRFTRPACLTHIVIHCLAAVTAASAARSCRASAWHSQCSHAGPMLHTAPVACAAGAPPSALRHYYTPPCTHDIALVRSYSSLQSCRPGVFEQQHTKSHATHAWCKPVPKHVKAYAASKRTCEVHRQTHIVLFLHDQLGNMRVSCFDRVTRHQHTQTA
jgi:hypothetical protein